MASSSLHFHVSSTLCTPAPSNTAVQTWASLPKQHVNYSGRSLLSQEGIDLLNCIISPDRVGTWISERQTRKGCELQPQLSVLGGYVSSLSTLESQTTSTNPNSGFSPSACLQIPSTGSAAAAGEAFQSTALRERSAASILRAKQQPFILPAFRQWAITRAAHWEGVGHEYLINPGPESSHYFLKFQMCQDNKSYPQHLIER